MKLKPHQIVLVLGDLVDDILANKVDKKDMPAVVRQLVRIQKKANSLRPLVPKMSDQINRLLAKLGL